jgi:DNA-binding NarL/FixJ family response regulator
MAEASFPPTSPLIRVLALDQTRMNTQLLADYLAREKKFLVIEAESAADAILAVMGSEKPDVVLLSPILEDDPAMGLRVARQLRALHPDAPIIMLLDASERSSVVEAFRAGALGVFCRTEPLQTLAKCIECAHRGQVWANSRELEYLLDAVSEAMSVWPPGDTNLSSLSKREQDVVLCVLEGLSNREIAQRLKLTEHTVKNYLFRVFDKLGVSSRVEVVLYVFKLLQSSATSQLDAKVSHAEMSPTVSAKPPRNKRKRE